jgi:hypothetical protein
MSAPRQGESHRSRLHHGYTRANRHDGGGRPYEQTEPSASSAVTSQSVRPNAAAAAALAGADHGAPTSKWVSITADDVDRAAAFLESSTLEETALSTRKRSSSREDSGQVPLPEPVPQRRPGRYVLNPRHWLRGRDQSVTGWLAHYGAPDLRKPFNGKLCGRASASASSQARIRSRDDMHMQPIRRTELLVFDHLEARSVWRRHRHGRCRARWTPLGGRYLGLRIALAR